MPRPWPGSATILLGDSCCEALDERRQVTIGTPGRAWTLIILVAISAATLWLRAGLTYDEVLGGDEVVFPYVDPWYHARLQTALAENYPLPLGHDPYALYPTGQTVPVAPLFDWAVVTASRLSGGGANGGERLQYLSAWFPPLMALVTVWLVYAVGRRLVDPAIGLLAAMLAVVYPPDFLDRTQLGAIDHHAAEVLLSSAVLWAAVVLLQRVQSAGRPIGTMLLLGVLLSAYLASWGGGALLVALLLLWISVQHMVDVGCDRDPGYLRLFSGAGAVALLCLLPVVGWLPRGSITLAALSLLVVTPWVLRWWLPSGRPSWQRTLVGGGVLMAGSAAMIVAAPDFFGSLVGQFGRLLPTAQPSLVGEASSLIFGEEGASFGLFMAHFGLTGFLFVGGLMIWLMEKSHRQRPESLLFFVWSLFFLVAALGQRRFGYYLAVSLPLMLAWVLRDVGLSLAFSLKTGDRNRIATGAALVLVVAFSAVGWRQSVDRVSHATQADTAWLEALRWLREATPEPFAAGNDCYTGVSPECDTARYGVLAPWYAGYWIVERGRRVPIANPTQNGLEKASRAYVADAAKVSQAVLGDLGAGYVVVTDEMLAGEPRKAPQVVSGFRYLVRSARLPLADFILEHPPDGDAGQSFLPAYYRSLLSRLYLFGVGAVAAEGPVQLLAPRAGGWQVASVARSYPQAVAMAAAEGQGEWVLACPDPLLSCVPLDAISDLEPVFESGSVSARFAPNGGALAAVRIYEYFPQMAIQP